MSVELIALTKICRRSKEEDGNQLIKCEWMVTSSRLDKMRMDGNFIAYMKPFFVLVLLLIHVRLQFEVFVLRWYRRFVVRRVSKLLRIQARVST